ncbi:MAG: ECF-type sigma factor [Planctomycetota bacterium]
MADITEILNRLDRGDQTASEELLPVVYQELRQLAKARMASERSDHTLQTTALVHEAYLRLVDRNQVQRWESKGHFFGAAAEAMRRILVEHARRKLGKQRGGDREKLALDFEVPSRQVTDPETVLQVSEALDRLADQEPQICELVKLHCFAGFSIVEAAEMLGISKSSAYNHWNYAKALVGKILSS